MKKYTRKRQIKGGRTKINQPPTPIKKIKKTYDIYSISNNDTVARQLFPEEKIYDTNLIPLERGRQLDIKSSPDDREPHIYSRFKLQDFPKKKSSQKRIGRKLVKDSERRDPNDPDNYIGFRKEVEAPNRGLTETDFFPIIQSPLIITDEVCDSNENNCKKNGGYKRKTIRRKRNIKK